MRKGRLVTRSPSNKTKECPHSKKCQKQIHCREVTIDISEHGSQGLDSRLMLVHLLHDSDVLRHSVKRIYEANGNIQLESARIHVHGWEINEWSIAICFMPKSAHFKLELQIPGARENQYQQPKDPKVSNQTAGNS